ncbi:hypothetical protein FOZ62_000799, partial [Perkinsus olseni]
RQESRSAFALKIESRSKQGTNQTALDRLDDLCKKHQKRLERFRGNVQELEDDRAFLEEEITASRTEFNALKNAVGQAQTAVERRKDRARSSGIPGGEGSRAERDSRGREQHSIGPEQSSDTLQEGELRERYDQVVEDFNRSIRTEKAAINRLRDDTRDEMRGSNNVQPGAVDGLVDIFTRCVDEVKGRIVERRNDSAKEHAKTKSESAKSRVEPRDVGLGWLTAGDRKHILETFLLDKKVLQLLLDEAPSSKESGVL